MNARIPVVVFLLVALAGAGLAGQIDVQDLLPADAIVAVCYYGDSTDLEKTAMYQLLQEPEVREWLTSLRQTLVGANQLAAAFLRVNLLQLKPLLGCQIGLAVMPAAGPALGAPVDVLLVAKVGDAQANARQSTLGLLTQIGAMMPAGIQKVQVGGIEMTRLGVGPIGLLYGFRDDYLLLSTSQATMERALGGQGGTLATVKGFQRAAKLGGSPVALGLYNHVAVMERLGAAAPPEALAVMAELGLNEVRSAGFRLGARGRALVSTIFVQTAGERKGLLKVLAADPIDRELTKLIPRDAAIASVSNIDAGALYDTVLAVAQIVAGMQDIQVRQVVADFEQQAGVNLRKDLVASMGRGTVVTTAGESLLPALVISQAVTDGDKIEKSLAALVKQLDVLIKAEAGDHASAAIKSIAFGKHTIRYLVTPGVPVPLAPCYARVGDRMVFAVSPIHLKDYLLFLDGAEPSLLENRDFMAMEKLIPKDAVSYSYSDFGRSFVGIYRMVGPLLTAAHGIPRNPVAIDLANMPAARTIQKHMFGAVSYMYATEDMVVWECHSPLGIETIGPLPAVIVGGVGAGILMPALTRARGAARATVSMNNLKQIGMACMMHTADHNGELPPNFGALLKGNVITAQILVAPNDRAPRAVGGQATSYVYLLDEAPGLKLKIGDVPNPPMVPLAWERRPFGRRGRNVVFVDGHVEAMREPVFQQRITRVRTWLKKKVQEQKGEF